MNLAHPEYLWLWIGIPILGVLAVFVSLSKRQAGDGLTADRLRTRLVRQMHALPRWLSLGLMLAAAATFIFALARPQGDAGEINQVARGRNVMIALDLSRSMRVTDVNPDRLGQAKILIYEILETLGNDRVGLIGFSGSPFLFAPLTIDHGAVRETVEQMDEEWLPVGGSDISSAIKLATDTLKQTGQKNNTLILISDGEEHEGDLDAVVAEAEQSGVRIFAIGVGTEDGGFVPHPDFSGGFLLDSSGAKILSRLEADVMRELASSTEGRYVVAGGGGDIPAMIEAAVQGMDVFEMKGGKTRVLIEFFQWAVLPGIFFLMASIVAGTRWRGVSAILLGAIFFAPSTSMAAGDLWNAKQLFSDKRFSQARDAYRSLADRREDGDAAPLRLAEGLSAYEALDFRGARSAYSRALLAEDRKVAAAAHQGMGNTLFQLGWIGLSGSRYPKGERTPDMETFDTLVRDQLEKMKQADSPESGDKHGFVRMQAIIINWSDAVRHYRTALEKNPKDHSAVGNANLTMMYLKRLAELLDEDKKQNEEEMMQQMLDQQNAPLEGEGDSDDPSKQAEPKKGDEGDPGDEKEPDPKQPGEKEEENSEGQKPKESEKSNETGEDQADPNESPEERAARLLEENSDVEKGPLNPGQTRRFRNPEKDW